MNQPLKPTTNDAPRGVIHQLTDALDTAPVGLVVCSTDGVILDANEAAARLFDIDSSTLRGLSLIELLDDSEQDARSAVGNLISAREMRSQRIRTKTRSGSVLEVDASAATQVLADGDTPVVLVWLQNVAEQLNLQQSLLRSEKLSALGEIVAGVAHELNNPLTGILGNAQLLQREELSAGQRKRLERIVSESERCHVVVQNLLGFAGTTPNVRVETNVNELVESILTLIDYQLRTDGIEMKTRFDPSVPTAALDRNVIARAILNIAHNAQQALVASGRPDRRFEVRTAFQDGEVYIRLSDNGPGIDPELTTKIFQPFFSTRTVGDGAGLGLSIAYGAAREHGGTIDVESTPGEGTAFIIRLPAGKQSR